MDKKFRKIEGGLGNPPKEILHPPEPCGCCGEVGTKAFKAFDIIEETLNAVLFCGNCGRKAVIYDVQEKEPLEFLLPMLQDVLKDCV